MACQALVLILRESVFDSERATVVVGRSCDMNLHSTAISVGCDYDIAHVGVQLPT